MDQGSIAVALKMTIALGAVLLIFGLTAMCAKKFMGRSGFIKKGRSTEKALEVLSFHNLGPGKALYLVRCLNKQMLVGVTNGNINLLTDMGDIHEDHAEDFESSLVEEFAQSNPVKAKKSFASSLKEIVRV